MSSSFIQTSRALDRDNFKAAKVLALLAVVILLVWVFWFFSGSVTLQETAPARVTFISDPFPIIVPRDGKLLSHQMVLNRQVVEGDVLLQLDGFQAQMRRDEVLAQRDRLRQERRQLEAEVKSAEGLQKQHTTRAQLEQQEAQLALEQQQTRLTFLNDQLQRTERLYREGKIAELTYLEEKSQRDEAQQQAALLQVSSDRLLAQTEERSQELGGDLLRLNSALASNQGSLAEIDKRIAELDHEQAQYVVRAPTGGTLAEVTPLAVGTQLREGQTLGQLLTTEKHIVRASFTPAAAIGKLSPGHFAKMRLTGFPWLQYGEVELRVMQVASESRNGRIRVDFEVLTIPNAITLRHGLPGHVRVETEHLRPIQLLLRSVGGLVQNPDPASEEDLQP